MHEIRINLFHALTDVVEIARFRLSKLLLNEVVKKAQQGIVKAMDVDDHDGFAVVVQLLEDGDLCDFFKGAKPAGQGDKRIGAEFHGVFARSHVIGPDQLIRIGIVNIVCPHGFRNDPDHLSACFVRGHRDLAHESNFASAKDERVSVLADLAAHVASGLKISRIDLIRRRTVNAKMT